MCWFQNSGGNYNLSSFDKVECNCVKGPYSPSFELGFEMGGVDFIIWKFLFQELICFNKSTIEYIEKDKVEVALNETTLGVLVRGTDYTKLKPRYHPVAPTIEEVIHISKSKIKELDLKQIYVATEDKTLFDSIVRSFEDRMVLENQRVYFDELYLSLRDGSALGNVHLKIKNENY